MTVTGDVTFDEGSFYVDGATLAGEFSSILGGTETGSSFNAGGLGGDPCSQGGELTDVGDGFGIVANSSGVDESEIDVLGVDLSLDFVNTSGLTHVLTVKLDFSNSVDVGGADAFADSSFTLDEPCEFFFTDLISDIPNGDEKNGAPLGTEGAFVSDSGMSSWDVTLGPGESVAWTGAFTLATGAFPPDFGVDFGDAIGSNFSSCFVADLTVVPEPSTMLLLTVGFLAARKRKSIKL